MSAKVWIQYQSDFNNHVPSDGNHKNGLCDCYNVGYIGLVRPNVGDLCILADSEAGRVNGVVREIYDGYFAAEVDWSTFESTDPEPSADSPEGTALDSGDSDV